MSTDKPHSKYAHVYAVVRVDTPLTSEQAGNFLAVPKVFSSREEAEKEVSRLNQLNSGKGCLYLLCTAHLVP